MTSYSVRLPRTVWKRNRKRNDTRYSRKRLWLLRVSISTWSMQRPMTTWRVDRLRRVHRRGNGRASTRTSRTVHNRYQSWMTREWIRLNNYPVFLIYPYHAPHHRTAYRRKHCNNCDPYDTATIITVFKDLPRTNTTTHTIQTIEFWILTVYSKHPPTPRLTNHQTKDLWSSP